MRAILTNFGTLGDIQPFVALAVELKRHGHQPVLAAAPSYRALAQLHDLDFIPVGPDLRAAQSGITQAMMGSPDVVHSAGGMLQLFQPLVESLPRMFEDLRAACRGADVLISGRVQPAARMVHDLTHLPFVTVLVEHSGSGGGGPAFQAAVRGLVNPLREAHGLPPLDNPLVDGLSNQLVLTALSRHVRPPAADLPPHHHTVGYCFLDEPGFTPDAELAAFLAEGEPPVCITFGSMTHADPEALTEALVQATVRSGRRALIQHGWSGLGQRALPSTVRALGQVPHAWLFSRVSCVVHHGGAGTTGAAFRAGVPQVVVPHTYDQFTWGEVVQELGCGGAALPIGELNAERLGDALSTVHARADLQASAARLGEQLRAEHGTMKARHLLEDLVRRVGLASDSGAENEADADDEGRQQRRRMALKQQRARKVET
ncbi:glycosyltransferase [Myxococcus sp. CA039A]|uniref:glycosyltransferase n=1 Tax=Myxococcus sp. CA039A TaxID=2741737 RepID=UPI00157B116F|nr:glycosyltransferase [Myxococcus sp. CA039A]NTX52308.1 glycosyltransferase family 1 protein [Myxococcus sp. CA039A]